MKPMVPDTSSLLVFQIIQLNVELLWPIQMLDVRGGNGSNCPLLGQQVALHTPQWVQLDMLKVVGLYLITDLPHLEIWRLAMNGLV